MIRVVYNWVAVVAVLAVAMLGVLAIDKAADSRTKTMREGMINTCLRQNEARVVANAEIAKLARFGDTLRESLIVADQDSKLKTTTRIKFARLAAQIDNPQRPHEITLIDCEKEIPRP